MKPPSADDWREWRGSYSRLPAVTAYPHTPFPESWLPWWRHSPHSVLLETGKAGRYTILAPRFERLLVCGDTSTEILRRNRNAAGSSQGGRAVSALPQQPDAAATSEIGPNAVPCGREHDEFLCERTLAGSPLEALREWTRQQRSPRLAGAPPFLGGLIGFFSYDLARLLEKLPARARDDLGLPVALFAVAEEVYVFDHADSTLFCVANRHFEETPSVEETEESFAVALARTIRMKTDWDARANEPVPYPQPPMQSTMDTSAAYSFSKDDFIAAVRRVQDYIRTGDTYQTNLSIRETRPLHAAPEEVYEELRRINPSPYMALLRLPGWSLVSGSPELLVRLRDGKLEARPIAGTRPRGSDSLEDASLNRDLIENGKERAEHLMLVDLIRNDLGRVSVFGSVRVTEFMTVESYSHVMHIVSHIEGVLSEEKDLFDAIAAAFPGGTITGAPKVRTMEIIEELEPVRRGPYTGSIGWIGFAGDMELNITIRTLLALDGRAHVQAGAGIVIDSDPEREYQESLDKARALWAAVEAAEANLLEHSANV